MKAKVIDYNLAKFLSSTCTLTTATSSAVVRRTTPSCLCTISNPVNSLLSRITYHLIATPTKCKQTDSYGNICAIFISSKLPPTDSEPESSFLSSFSKYAVDKALCLHNSSHLQTIPRSPPETPLERMIWNPKQRHSLFNRNLKPWSQHSPLHLHAQLHHLKRKSLSIAFKPIPKL
jgi:hypothetical protein